MRLKRITHHRWALNAQLRCDPRGTTLHEPLHLAAISTHWTYAGARRARKLARRRFLAHVPVEYVVSPADDG